MVAENARVALNPDGAHPVPLLVLVLAPTGVTYAHNCGGHGKHGRCAEGFLIPMGGSGHAEALSAFFWRNFRGAPPADPDAWEAPHLARLENLVGRVSCWSTEPGCTDGPHKLGVDKERLDDLTEGWVPVRTAMGPGVLIFQGSD